MDGHRDFTVTSGPSGEPGSGQRHGVSWRRITITLISTLTMTASALVIAPVASAQSAPATYAAAVHPAAARMASFDSQMIAYVNSARTANGLNKLSAVGGLTNMSVWWSNQQLASGTLKHTSGGASIASSRYGVKPGLWGENVGRFPASATAKQLFDAYMASPTHRANILNPRYNFIGMGTVSNSSTGYNTTEFAESVAGHKTPAQQESADKAAAKKAAAQKAAADKAAADKAAARKAAAAKKAAADRAAANKAAADRAAAKKAAAAKAPTNSASTDNTPALPEPDSATHLVSYQYETSPQSASSPRQAAAAPKAPAPAMARGTVSASFGALTVPNLTIEIRDETCKNVVIRTTTGAAGTALISVDPGTYCAVVTDAPAGVQAPDPVTFTVTSGGEFTVAWDELTLTPTPPTQTPVSRSGFTMRPL